MDNKKMKVAAKNWNIMLKVSGGIFQALGFVCIIFAVLIALFGGRMTSELSVTLDFIKLYLADGVSVNQNFMKMYLILGLLVICVICFMITFAVKIIRKILEPMMEGRPFEEKAPAYLKKVAWIVLAGGILTQIIGIIERVILAQSFPIEQIISTDAIAKIEYTFVFDFSCVIIFCVIMFLSYVFEYGQELQRESDETL